MKQYYDIFNEPIIRNITKPMGRPKKTDFKTDENGNRIKTSVIVYENRGWIISKMKVLKNKYSFSYPEPSDYIGKTEIELLHMLNKMTVESNIIQNNIYLDRVKRTQQKNG